MKRFYSIAFALLASMPLMGYGADAPTAGKARLEFVRTSGLTDILKARVEVNGRRVGELAKGESASEMVDPGNVNIKVDSSVSPGQHVFSFTTEADGIYRIEIGQSLDKANIQQTFGWPVKVANPNIADAGGSLKATIANVKLPKPADPPAALVVPPPAPVAVATPVVTQAVVPLDKPIEKSSDGGATKVEEQLRSLKRLFDQGLISGDVYAEKQRKILETMQ